MPTLGNYETLGIFIVIAIIGYIFRDVLDRFELFGFSLKTNSKRIADFESDYVLEDVLHDDIKGIDNNLRMRLRVALSSLINEMIRSYPDFKEVITDCRFVLSVSICDNNHRAVMIGDDWSEKKYQDCLIAITEKQDVTSEIKSVIRKLVSLWRKKATEEVTRMIERKIELYKTHQNSFKSVPFQTGCRKRLEKNEYALSVFENRQDTSIQYPQ